MKMTLKLEEAAALAASIFAFAQLDYAWWVYPALFFLPDLGMLGYLKNPRLGAVIYNLFHHKGIALLAWLCGFYLHIPELTLTGIILFGHASFDRLLGYGLKYADSFHNTHLGKLKEEKEGLRKSAPSGFAGVRA
jgi:hypothetical protein